ncbi:hypothetical protein [uncultured Brachyspira sp.]|uniref:tetratricopeptide repeat protein n=1 Tax=uncultured Brachyspira sp. TaxID=221953 RepID=UPI00260B9BF5|nr:hypothetical protein [uncultured Brachyspira sp.]
MIKQSLAVLLVILLSFAVSCQKPNNQNNLEEDYIEEIEKEYQNSSSNDVVVETNDYADDYIMSNNDNTQVNNNPNNNYQANNNSSVKDTYSTSSSSSSSSVNARRRPLKATIDTFYSPWTSKDDPLIIREIRVMIANNEYTKALDYINKLDFNNLPADVDVGQLYQFKGIVHYFLAKGGYKSNNIVVRSNIISADECFKKVEGLTKIEKFKPLSLLWNGMLYQTYSNNETELQEAIALFDRVITEYPRTRFANDAVFYKAVTMKKLGMPENEYNDLFLSIKRGGFVDTLVFSQVINDYVPANDLVDKEMVK